MKAIILAAGRGNRLKPLTDKTPKSLLPLGNTTLIHRSVQILKQTGINDISIVTGYLKEKLFQAFPSGIKFYVNEHYDQTDQAGSLFQAKNEFLGDDVLIITADLFCPASVYAEIIQNFSPICLAIEKKETLFDDAIEKVYLESERISQIGKTNVSNSKANGEFLGMTKIARHKCSRWLKKLQELLLQNAKLQIVQFLQHLLDEGERIDYIEVRDPWCEVDDLATLEKARNLLKTNVSYSSSAEQA